MRSRENRTAPALFAGAALAATLTGCAVSRPVSSSPGLPHRPHVDAQAARALLDTAQILQAEGRYAASQDYLERALAEVSQASSTDTALRPLIAEVVGSMRNNLPWSLAPSETGEDEHDGQMLLDSLDETDLAATTVFTLDSTQLSRYRAEALLDSTLTFDLPVELNDRVLLQLRTFKERIPSTFQRWLERKGRWEAEFSERLATRGVPQDLIYLAMIESGFNSRATSPAAAAGIWQFIPSTGRRYGLRIDRYVDERRDPIKATEAAIDFLSFLYKRYGDWRLAMAAYNCGEGCVDRAIRRSGTNDYWQIPIPQETRNYVPRVFAAAILGKRPELHGFKYTPWAPLVADTFTVEGGIPLMKVADIVGAPPESLVLLNPSLVKGMTPPSQEPWVLRLPVGSRERFQTAYATLDRSYQAPQPSRLSHRVRRGETLQRIASRYGVTVSSLKSWNRIHGKKVKAGRTLVVYTDTYSPSVALPTFREPPMERRHAILARSGIPTPTPRHKVRRGETLARIASRYGVTSNDLVSWNSLESRTVKAGTSLAVSAPNADPTLAGIPRSPEPESVQPDSTAQPEAAIPQALAATIHHKVRHGESLARIARANGVTVRQIMDWNRLPSARVKAGKVLRIHSSASSEPVVQIAARSRTSESEPVHRTPESHRVRRGETASSIALRYGVSTDDLLEANGLRGSRLRIGQKLVLPRSKASRASTRVAAGQETTALRTPEAPRTQARDNREAPADRTLRLTRYTVRPGDTLYSIARARSTTVDSLKQINGLSKANLRVGQIIKVPGNG